MKKLHYIPLSFVLLVFHASCVTTLSSSITPTTTNIESTSILPSITPTYILRDLKYVPVMCELMNRRNFQTIAYGTPIIFTWGWEATSEPLILDFIENTSTRITLDNNVISDGLFYEIRRKTGSNLFEVLWAREVGILSFGIHTLIYDLKFNTKISDGNREYGPGTDIESMHDECYIDVIFK